MRKFLVFTLALLSLTAWAASGAYAQGNNASIGGVVMDTSKALIPGVTVTLTNTNTGVVDTRLTNDSGAFQFPSVQPGTYQLKGDLMGFSPAVENNLALGVATQSRVNLTLQVGAGKGETVQVNVPVESRINETSSSVGEVLTRDRIENLPLVGNNVLNLLVVLPGFRESSAGQAFDTVGGLGLNSVNATINGMTSNSTRNSAELFGYQTFTSTVMNPDLVGEIRLILAPVDAELGNGNAQVQIQTRSGTNKYTGAGVWVNQNTGLNANTWTNNHTPTSVNGVVVSGKTTPDWRNINDLTGSFGGPIIKNKTFFFFLIDKQLANSRTLATTSVLTDAARQGIFRYFPGWNPGNAAFANPTVFGNTTSGTFQSVDALGNPLPTSQLKDPATGGAYTGQLTCFSVFGNVLADGVSPITQAVKDQYCPGGNFVIPNAGTTWDPKRARPEATGYMQRALALAPHANNFNIAGTGDGLNTAANRYLRTTKGSNSTNAIIGVVTSAGDYDNRLQTNLKIDHNINKNNRVSVAWTNQREDGSGSATPFQNGFQGNTTARTNTLTVNGTSTLTASLVNESRFGWNGVNRGQQPAWANPNNSATTASARSFLLTGGADPVSGVNMPVIFNPGANVNGFMDFNSFDLDASNPVWDYADTMRWTRGKHSLSFGGEYRRLLSTGYNSSAYSTAGLGNFNNLAATAPPLNTATAFSNTGGDTSGTTVGLLPGLIPGAFGIGTTRTSAVNLSYLFYGSLGSVATPYWINSQSDIAGGNWRDTTTQKDLLPSSDPAGLSHQTRGQVTSEWSAFLKDDFKIQKHLTLNLGVRYDIDLSTYLRQGLTNNFVGDGIGMYGAGRPAATSTSADLLSGWLRPGNLFITGYGDNVAGNNGLGAAAPVQCQLGVTQTPIAPTDGGPVLSLPTSTCDPKLMSTIQFIGPGTVNPTQHFVPVHGKLSPAIGFAWQVPWFGEGKTTVRGGYQRTYGGAGAAFSGGALSGPGGDGTTPNAANIDVTQPAIANILATRALNIEDIALLVPVPPTRKPGQPIPIANRGTSPANAMYAPDYVTPYTDNITLSITRNLGRNYTIDARFIDTLGRKQPATIDLNTDNVYHNQALMDALNVTRAGGNAPLFDQMLMGLNIVGNVNGYNAPVGQIAAATSTTTNGVTTTTPALLQRGSEQLRRSATFSANLANGNYVGVVDSLMSLIPVGSAGVGLLEPNPTNLDPITGFAANPAQRLLRNGCNRIADGKTKGFTISDPSDPNFGQTELPTCFPENFVYTNPQLGTANLTRNMKHSNYQSGQIQFTARPIQGVSIQSTFSLSKTMSTTSSTAGTFTDPLNPELDYGPSYNNIGREFRTNGTFELPIGPNKLLLGNSSGWIARAIEKWQTSIILTVPQGPLRNIVGGNFLYANGRPDVVGPWTNPRGEVNWNGGPSTNFFGGTTSAYATYKDPQCLNNVAGVDPNTGFNLQTSCTLTGLGQIVPAGTPNAVTNGAGTLLVLPLLQNPLPGHQGNLGVGTMRGISNRRIDMNASKRFRITESKSLQFRIDATNVLNHPQENDPVGVDQATNALTTNTFGQINGKSGLNARTFQAQLRLSF